MAHWITVQVKTISPFELFPYPKSYLQNRHFLLKTENEYTELFPINAGVPQGSVFGPLLYLLFTAEVPISPETTSATFADDTVIATMIQLSLQANY
jgi:hypothetical protein